MVTKSFNTMHVKFILRKVKLVLLFLLVFVLLYVLVASRKGVQTLYSIYSYSLEQFVDNTGSSERQESRPAVRKPAQNIVFLKTHKTASTTFMNILYRYGDTRNLTFVFMRGEADLDFPKHFRSDKVPRLKNGQQYNILCRHTRFNKTSMQELMPDDSFYITSLRGPVSHLQSRFDFYNMAGYFRFTKFLDPFSFFIDFLDEHMIEAFTKKEYVFSNPLLFDLGMTNKDILNETLVNQTIAQLDRDFDFVILTEYFDECIVLLKDILHWNLTDMLYFKMWVHKRERHPLTTKQIDKIHNLNRMDLLLYQHFNRSLWKLLEKQDSKFWREVKVLRTMNKQMMDNCLDLKNSQPHRLDVVGREVFFHHVRKDAKDIPTCNRMSADPWSYTSYLMRKQMKLLEDQNLRWGFIPQVWQWLGLWDPIRGYRYNRRIKQVKHREDAVPGSHILSILCGVSNKCRQDVVQLQRRSTDKKKQERI